VHDGTTRRGDNGGKFSDPRADISRISSYIMSIRLMLHIIERFSSWKWWFWSNGSLFRCCTFVDEHAMLSAPFLHEFQRKLSCWFLFSFKHFYESPTGWYHAYKINSSTLNRPEYPIGVMVALQVVETSSREMSMIFFAINFKVWNGHKQSFNIAICPCFIKHLYKNYETCIKHTAYCHLRPLLNLDTHIIPANPDQELT
jgi:hypothetical protein